MAYALIVAAGKGTRLPGAQLKQYRPLAGVPVLTRTLQAMEACGGLFEELVLVVAAEEIDFCRRRIVAPAGLRTPVRLVAGGERRQDSVFSGLQAIVSEEGIVAVHDGARPLVPPALVRACVDGARRHGAAIAALSAADTVKRCGPDGVIAATLRREEIWLAQTPQAFHIGLLRRGHEEARRRGVFATDDAALIERLGVPVHIVPGSRRNLKITTPEDLLIAEMLAARPESGEDD
jgi:2-C-methyl-D-erythritol 4-phosphate cytidylyltransferase